MDNDLQTNKEQKNILYIYIAFIASIIMGFVPKISFSLVAMFLFTGVLISAYSRQRKAEDDSLTKNHMTFIIRTIWIASFILIPSMITGTIYLLTTVDQTYLYPCMDILVNTSNVENIKVAKLLNVMQPCIDELIYVNKTHIITGLLITTLPVVAYFIYRVTKGIYYASKATSINNPKRWL